MRDTVNANRAEIASMTSKHDDCCQRLGEMQKHILDRNLHIDRDMWKELTERLKSIEEYIRENR